MEELLTLQGLLIWLASGAGAGIAGYWLLGKLAWYKKLARFEKRIVGIAVPGLLAVVANLLLVAVGYQPAPVGMLAWFEMSYSAFAAVVVALAAHSVELRS